MLVRLADDGFTVGTGVVSRICSAFDRVQTPESLLPKMRRDWQADYRGELFALHFLCSANMKPDGREYHARRALNGM
jgi:hypothetical protein